jgi:hypothetical protein
VSSPRRAEAAPRGELAAAGAAPRDDITPADTPPARAEGSATPTTAPGGAAPAVAALGPGAEPRSRFAPGARLAGFAAGGLPFAVADAGTGFGLGAALLYDAVLLVGAFVESRRLARDAPAVERRMDRRLVVGMDNRITLRLHNPHPRALRVVVRDDLPEGW